MEQGVKGRESQCLITINESLPLARRYYFHDHLFVFVYLGFCVTFNTVQLISRWVVGRAKETSTYSSLGFCTVNYRPTASNYQLSHLRPCRESNPGLRGGRRECYHSATLPPFIYKQDYTNTTGWNFRKKLEDES